MPPTNDELETDVDALKAELALIQERFLEVITTSTDRRAKLSARVDALECGRIAALEEALSKFAIELVQLSNNVLSVAASTADVVEPISESITMLVKRVDALETKSKGEPDAGS